MNNKKYFLKQVREDKKISQEKICEILGISRPTYQLIEKERKELTLSQMKKLATILNIPEQSFFTNKKSSQLSEKEIVSTRLPTSFGDFIFYVWNQKKGDEIVFLTTENLDITKPILLRVHSECLTGDLFHSCRCDCGEQKNTSLQMIQSHGNGVFIYLRQEGRGIGLYEKIKTYVLQDQGYDTHEANILLGHKPDHREYSWVKKVLDYLEVTTVKLLTNNPSKVSEISQFGVKVIERVPLLIQSNIHNRKYFETKKQKFKHFFGEESNYFYQFSYAENSEQVEKIGVFMEKFNKDPLLKICVGVYADSYIFNDKQKLKNIEQIFKAASHFTGFVPILHFTFKYSHNNKSDVAKIRSEMPYVEYLRLNDINENTLDVLKYANQFFITDIPLSNETFYLLDNLDFIKEIKEKKTFVMIDNSHGTGKSESYEILQEKIDKLISTGINDIGLCGGFGPEKLETYFKLKSHYRINFSIDAENGLKSENSLDIEKVKNYLSELINNK